ncbi:ABC transporter ATP-binding protein [Floricoccus penangensis]|uniref:Sodium ABC transporter ATP-binding protein n=1 Tax=Floricoccus penangensis TaxID=1859475 RepID=A0A9Q5JHC3_9LACT|nr:ABC transporter ATP-binding protein [Floricoccus penangensis]OFI47525.1 sodium ABC transporter ATP-binding protein [Floricoccus penangensis]URZ87958.1 ABC transporter ATP-binding protein [Floricoccus penangensis]
MVLELKNVTKTFGDKRAVSNLNMIVNPGQVMGLIGQNGAGKTTTFRMILDFIKADPGSVITWKGKEITPQIKQKIGFLPEERGLYQKLTVEDQILYFAELHGMNRADAKEKLKLWMDRLEVVGKVTDKVQTLSKGNAQKVQLIATIIHEPEFLILDEPFTGLDPVNTALMMQEINRLKEQGAAIIFSSHNMDGVEKLSDDLTMLKNGKTVLQGGVKEIRDSFGRTQIYLESDDDTSDLLDISGVESVDKRGQGRILRLENEEVGLRVFEYVARDGYVQSFMQAPPTLDEIFRAEVAINE